MTTEFEVKIEFLDYFERMSKTKTQTQLIMMRYVKV
jgi:hypothetical protein